MTTLIGLGDHPVNGIGTSWMQNNDFDYTALVSYYFFLSIIKFKKA